jgi:hypothetical protein
MHLSWCCPPMLLHCCTAALLVKVPPPEHLLSGAPSKFDTDSSKLQGLKPACVSLFASVLPWARLAWRPRSAYLGLTLATVLCVFAIVILLVLSRASVICSAQVY